MYILKPFTTVVQPTSGMPLIDCFVGSVKIGTITQNMMKKSEGNYIFRSAITLEGSGTHLYADSVENLQELALNNFRELICNLLD